MGSAATSGTRWWTQIDAMPIVLLSDVTAAQLSRAMDPLPADAPALVFCPPVTATTVATCIAEILTAFELAAIDLFPTWLPTTANLDDSPGAEATIRAAARSLAATGEDFGPFLAELGVRALRGRTGRWSAVSPQQRAAGLARVIARSLDRSRVALVLTAPPDASAEYQNVLTGTARWLTEQGGLTVWLLGGPLKNVDWISSWSVTVGEPEAAPPPAVSPATPIQLGAQGKPKAGIEALLARTLAQTDWAAHHVWNSGLTLGPLGPVVLPDIRWPAERVIVEIDGPEHHSAVKYAADRRRDATLMLNGYTVMRFTNDQVQSDLQYVLHTIHAVLVIHRSP